MNNRIEQLQQEIENEKKRILSCDHFFGEAFYNPIIEKEPYGYKIVGQGSDIWTEPTGYREVNKPRWTRECKKCGLKQHTTKQKVVTVKEIPDFLS